MLSQSWQRARCAENLIMDRVPWSKARLGVRHAPSAPRSREVCDYWAIPLPPNLE